MTDRKMPGLELVARVAALEGFVKVLIHRELKASPNSDILDALAVTSKDHAKTIGHREMEIHAQIHSEDFLETIRNEIEGAAK